MLNNNVINYEDISPIIYLKILLDEPPSTFSVRHIVIDEIQDYTYLQYLIFKILFKNSKFTLLGDLNQSINPLMNIGNYKKIVKAFNLSNNIVLNLNKSYRSTKEITIFTKALLNNNTDWDYIERNGIKPNLIKISKEKMIDKVLEDILNLKSNNYKSIAIITKSTDSSKKLYNNLKNNLDINLITKDDFKYPDGIVVLPSYLSKGLEFDAVLVYGCGDNDYNNEDERNLLYTVCTRALHSLNLYYSQKSSPFIENISDELYNNVKIY